VSLWRGRSELEVGRGGGSSEAGAEPWGRARQRSPPKAEAEAWGRARWSFLLRPRLNLSVVGFARVVGTAAGAGRATLFSCQIGQ
jgi:hypothetical protein